MIYGRSRIFDKVIKQGFGLFVSRYESPRGKTNNEPIMVLCSIVYLLNKGENLFD